MSIASGQLFLPMNHETSSRNRAYFDLVSDVELPLG